MFVSSNINVRALDADSFQRATPQQGILAATGRRLLPSVPICYKRYMRKWMRERMQRRKKSGEGQSPDQANAQANAPAPLQPRFYDDEPSKARAAPVVEAKSQREPEPAPEPSAGNAEAQPPSGSSRRRRSRGGRGGSRARAAGASPAPGRSAEGQANAPAPLEPRFYDSEPSGAGEAPVAESQSQREPEPAREPSAGNAEAQPRPRISRRRRSRGGRGGGSRPAYPSPVPAAERQLPAPKLVGGPQPAAEVAAVPARASKGTVVLAIGLPGSGKSSWFKRHSIRPLSSDLLRELLFDDAQEQRFQELVFSNLRSMLKARLIARRPMNYVDATNLTSHDRHSWIKLSKDYGYDVQGLFFDVPVEVCMERNQRRSRMVAEDVMRKMAAKLNPPTFDEGFSKITVVRVKQKEQKEQGSEAP